jgi:succinyl-CoA synthetase beta subunit
VNLHEFQAKEVLRSHGLPVPPGLVAETPDQASDAFSRLGVPLAVVKAQVHAGGRGRGTVTEKDLRTVRLQGGVIAVRSAAEAAGTAARMLGYPLVTRQTGPAGRVVRRVYVEAACDPARELYLGIALDRRAGLPVLMASSRGGMEIEEVAAKEPEAILRELFDVDRGLQDFQARRLAFALGFAGESSRPFCRLASALCRLYLGLDGSLVEINPLGVTKGGSLLALDVKLSVDDRALEAGRHPEIAALRDEGEEDPAERAAARAGFSYVSLGGSVGCLVNGAGLAMATMDLLELEGGAPANFLDVGGGARREQVREAFRLLVANPAVKSVFVNIFGGILQCDVLARGLVDAMKEAEVRVPVVVRLEGAAVEAGRAFLGESGLRIVGASDMADGARKAVAAAGGGP